MMKFNKKVLKFPRVILLLTALCLSGCYGAYEAERAYWLVNRKYSRFMKEFEAADEIDREKLVNKRSKEIIVDFRKMIISYPGWPLSAQAQLMIANIYNTRNEAEKAISEYKKVLKEYPALNEQCASALYAIAVIYQQEGSWPEAEENFKRVMKEYFYTNTGLKVPLPFSRSLRARGRFETAEEVYGEAVSKYTTYISENPDKPNVLLALEQLINCYGDRDKWQDAVDFLDNKIDKDPDTPLVLQSLAMSATIYETHLGNKEKAYKIYRRVIEKFPDSPAAQKIKEYLNL
ncbi:MAG: tetratricopeptide repeat protein [Candidatus Omnitrophica bacterium]|nr:tetratricopeptide repeat protein [Candidatus Omnitrophota bacterium]